MKFPRKQTYACKIFTVWEEDVPLQNGKTTRQSWVEHKPTVAVVAVNDQKEVLLIRQYRVPAGRDLLEIPAGTMDHGEESPAVCAGRELAEETGFRAGKLTELFAGYLLPGYCNEFMYFFLAEDLVYDPLTPDEDEFIAVLPTSFARACELLKDGSIVDAKTALGLLLAGRHCKQDVCKA
ncbi:MAG: NUDIX hydrolase [Smithellaceae bacterium]|nr:NUDIX hydrolase [Syntrophaceae bacterium]MDD4240162.1 NUDIX hydrolase [Smithellaceae bacterium]NLX51362.1 NUDIX hydrolase [Deltaproteobacteria bacterium]